MMRKILIVDDSVSMRNQMFLALGSVYQIISAVDGEDGFAKAQVCEPDLIVTDFNMPKLDGLGLTKKLRATPRFRDTPVVIVSSERERRTKLAALDAGATQWVAKPFTTEGLLNAVRRYDPAPEAR